MHKVTSVKAKAEYTLEVTFDDGTHDDICLADRLFEPLKDPDFFAQVQIDEFGAVCWPNEVDLAPDALYQKVVA